MSTSQLLMMIYVASGASRIHLEPNPGQLPQAAAGNCRQLPAPAPHCRQLKGAPFVPATSRLALPRFSSLPTPCAMAADAAPAARLSARRRVPTLLKRSMSGAEARNSSLLAEAKTIKKATPGRLVPDTRICDFCNDFFVSDEHDTLANIVCVGLLLLHLCLAPEHTSDRASSWQRNLGGFIVEWGGKTFKDKINDVVRCLENLERENVELKRASMELQRDLDAQRAIVELLREQHTESLAAMTRFMNQQVDTSKTRIPSISASPSFETPHHSRLGQRIKRARANASELSSDEEPTFVPNSPGYSSIGQSKFQKFNEATTAPVVLVPATPDPPSTKGRGRSVAASTRSSTPFMSPSRSQRQLSKLPLAPIPARRTKDLDSVIISSIETFILRFRDCAIPPPRCAGGKGLSDWHMIHVRVVSSSARFLQPVSLLFSSSMISLWHILEPNQRRIVLTHI